MLQLRNVTKQYADGTLALNDITLSFQPGMVGLLGPNGAGKSSLMRTIAGLQRPDSGEVFFNHINVLSHPQQLRTQLGYLPQSFGVYPNMSCQALLEHIAVYKGLSKRQRQHQIRDLLAITHLTEHAKRRVSQFSGGMRQRFGIAQALLGDPKLIIMDEPTAGLDPAERQSLNKLLVEISQQRLLLLSTHIVEDIESLCQQVAIIHQGSLVNRGSVTELIQPIDHQVWQSQVLPKGVKPQQILSQTFQHGLPYYRIFSPSCPHPQARQIQASLQDAYFHTINTQGAPAC